MVMRRDHGFTYLAVLFIVAIMSAGLALIGEVWHTAAVREKEAELLFVGNQYRKAIERYYFNGPRLYPRTLADLVKDPRKLSTERYLRKLYPDPVTGSDEWGIVTAPDGGIMGVYSLAKSTPLKQAGFRSRDQSFADAPTYQEWRFLYEPITVTAPSAPLPGQEPRRNPGPK
jgi:type II secretory pathway pseudopilin PulG